MTKQQLHLDRNYLLLHDFPGWWDITISQYACIIMYIYILYIYIWCIYMMIHAFGLGSTGCWNFTQIWDLSWRPLLLGSLSLPDVLLNFCLAWSNLSLDSVWEVTFMYLKLSCSVGRKVKVMEVVSIYILFWLLDPTSIQLLYLLGGVRIRDYRIMDVFLKAVVSQVANGKTWKTSKLFQIGVIFPSSTSTHKPFVKNRAIFENLGSSYHCVGPVSFQFAWGN